MTNVFRCNLEVRDYELDSQGIVNNSVYLNYLEHARHLFLRDAGQDFNQWQKEGIDPVVRRIELDYVRSLKGGEWFDVETYVEKKGHVRFLFHQRICRVWPAGLERQGIEDGGTADRDGMAEDGEWVKNCRTTEVGATTEGREEVLRAVITVVFVQSGRPVRPPDVMLDALEGYMKPS